MKRKRTALILITALSITGSVSGIVSAKTGSASSGKKVEEKSIKEYPFRRVDFEIRGSKCVVCIRRLVRSLRKSKGVSKADISILKPYGGVVVFERDKTSFERLLKRMKHEKVTTVNVEKTDIKTVPSILIPKSLRIKLKRNRTLNK